MAATDNRAADPPRRREVFGILRRAGRPLGVADVAERLGIHANTARFHLDALVAKGTVERTVELPSGPGRPRTVYRPQPGMDRGGVRNYRLLARMLLSQLAATAPDPGEAAREAGRAWGRYLAVPPPPFRRLTAEEATARLTGLLDDLGFDPEPRPAAGAPEAIRLRHCPFLELAEEYGQIACPLHLGLLQGALAELGAPVSATGLVPFAEPGACLAHLARTDTG
ncbi:helix-turn-helix transcriptional regulator [Streptomyces orinoci]|uniref:Helix-turn-helix domain-containing protein n=1 Tax=Streptomyces orinoci TaxID=67339 RepID=A0ABV3K097_STRON|nr:helix-turn-helix domain-containing protein [Streptomyces orinoci]